MASTSDAELRVKAEQALSAAQEIMGWQIDGLYEVGADDYWAGVADRAKRALDKAKKLPRSIAGKAASKIKVAAQAGLDKASSATDAVRDLLRSVLRTASGLVISPFLLLGIAWLLLESTGKPSAWRASHQARYREQYARGKRFVLSGGRSF